MRLLLEVLRYSLNRRWPRCLDALRHQQITISWTCMFLPAFERIKQAGEEFYFWFVMIHIVLTSVFLFQASPTRRGSCRRLLTPRKYWRPLTPLSCSQLQPTWSTPHWMGPAWKTTCFPATMFLWWTSSYHCWLNRTTSTAVRTSVRRGRQLTSSRDTWTSHVTWQRFVLHDENIPKKCALYGFDLSISCLMMSWWSRESAGLILI